MVVPLATGQAIALGLQTAAAREIQVATTGSDANPGGKDNPYLTIGKAASVAQPGDMVIVPAGTYREWVKPVRGGTGEDQRITYRAAAGAEVLVKGSLRVTSWTDEGRGVWKAELPNDLFGDYNPYALNLSGGWLEYGNWHHRGDVYLDGEALLETQTPPEVARHKGFWHGQAGEQTTVIRGNLIRRVPLLSHGAFGIWMDWANQGTRITGNIIYDTGTANIGQTIEDRYGKPITVDTNLTGAKRTQAIPGPLAELKSGINRIVGAMKK